MPDVGRRAAHAAADLMALAVGKAVRRRRRHAGALRPPDAERELPPFAMTALARRDPCTDPLLPDAELLGHEHVPEHDALLLGAAFTAHASPSCCMHARSICDWPIGLPVAMFMSPATPQSRGEPPLHLAVSCIVSGPWNTGRLAAEQHLHRGARHLVVEEVAAHLERALRGVLLAAEAELHAALVEAGLPCSRASSRAGT